MPEDQEVEYGRKAIDGCLSVIRNAAKVVNDPQYRDIGFYGFAIPDASSVPPLTPKAADERHFIGNAPNIATLRDAFHRM